MDNRLDPIEIIARVAEGDGKQRALEVWCYKASRAGWSVAVESGSADGPGAECAVVDVEVLRYRILHAKRVRQRVGIVPVGQHLIAAAVALAGGEADGVTWTWEFEHAAWLSPSSRTATQLPRRLMKWRARETRDAGPYDMTPSRQLFSRTGCRRSCARK